MSWQRIRNHHLHASKKRLTLVFLFVCLFFNSIRGRQPPLFSLLGSAGKSQCLWGSSWFSFSLECQTFVTSLFGEIMAKVFLHPQVIRSVSEQPKVFGGGHKSAPQSWRLQRWTPPGGWLCHEGGKVGRGTNLWTINSPGPKSSRASPFSWHRLDRHEFEQALGVGDGQGSLASCSPWGCRVRHDWVTELNSQWVV